MAEVEEVGKKKQGQSDLPAITGKQLIKLLEKDGWTIKKRATHGIGMNKQIQGETKNALIPDKRESLKRGVLMAILGPKQTNIGRDGLLRLIEKYGIK